MAAGGTEGLFLCAEVSTDPGLATAASGANLLPPAPLETELSLLSSGVPTPQGISPATCPRGSALHTDALAQRSSWKTRDQARQSPS